MKEPPNIITLDNGLRILHQRTRNSRTVHCGIIINAGTRDEVPENNGIAHFIEHSAFKGTKKRKSHHILGRIENVGGDINAYTDREKTCFYTTSLKKYAGRSIELLSDITFHPTFPTKELEKEKKVISEEIDMFEDTPEESIYDDFIYMLFPGHSLGYKILGKKSTVENFTRQDLLNFLKTNYVNKKIILSVVGNISQEKVKKYALKYLAKIPKGEKTTSRAAPGRYYPTLLRKQKGFQQNHCIIGTPAYSRHHPRRYALALLNIILGGDSMNSRLNLEIREKYGLVYHIESNYLPFHDSGIFTVEFSSNHRSLEKCIRMVKKEFKKLRENKLGKLQLNQGKRKFLGRIALAEENHLLQMQRQGKNMLDHGHIFTFEDIYRNIENIQAKDILAVANELLQEETLSTLIFE